MTGRSVRNAKRTISEEEFYRWKAWRELRPDAGERADWLASIMVNYLAHIAGALGVKSIQPTEGKLIEWGKHGRQ